MRATLIPILQKLAWTAYVLALIVGSLMPVNLPGPENSDKVMHFAAYALLVLLWPPAWPRPAWVMFTYAAGLGAALEVGQGILPLGRCMDALDALANAAGAALGLCLLLSWRHLRRRGA